MMTKAISIAHLITQHTCKEDISFKTLQDGGCSDLGLRTKMHLYMQYPH